jgi:hypothetical protein
MSNRKANIDNGISIITITSRIIIIVNTISIRD